MLFILFVVLYWYLLEFFNWYFLIISVNLFIDWLMLNCFFVLIGLLFLYYWNLGFGVFMVWYVKWIELFLIVDLFWSLRINFGCWRCFFGFGGFGLDCVFRVVGKGGFDFFIWVELGEMRVLIIGDVFVEICCFCLYKKYNLLIFIYLKED